jgi:hypothetical protein
VRRLRARFFRCGRATSWWRGKAWETPWIQVTAVSEDQTANVFRALLPMIQLSDSLNMEIADTGLTR